MADDDSEYNPAATITLEGTGFSSSALSSTDLAQRHWFLNKSFNSSLSLSERVTALRWQDDVAESIRVNMEQGTNLVKLTKELSSYSNEEDIAGWVKDVASLSRRVMAGDISAEKEFEQAVQSAKKEILDLGDLTATQSRGVRLARSYQRVVNAAEKLSSDGLDAAIETAIEKKTLYNAFRIAQNETNRAYAMGVYTRALDDEDAEAMQIDLSGSDNSCDECVEICEQDNGAGPGVYSLDQCPELPIHPNCGCIPSPVYVLPKGVSGDDLIDDEADFDTMERMPENLSETD